MVFQRQHTAETDPWQDIHEAVESSLYATGKCSLLISRSECWQQFMSLSGKPEAADVLHDVLFNGIVDTKGGGQRRIFCRFRFDDGLDGPPDQPWIGQFAFLFEGYERRDVDNRLTLEGVLHDRSKERRQRIHNAVRKNSAAGVGPLRIELEYDPVDPESIYNQLRERGYSNAVLIKNLKFFPRFVVRGVPSDEWQHYHEVGHAEAGSHAGHTAPSPLGHVMRLAGRFRDL